MITSQAVVLNEGRITRETLTVRSPQRDEVRVRIRAAGVCASDLHVVDGDWPYEGAVVLGHEAAGVVESVGPLTRNVKVGDLVSLCWFAPCGHCRGCLRAQPWLCRETKAVNNTLADGSTAFHHPDTDSPVWPYLGLGAFSEYVVVPESAAVKVPDDLPVEIAALIGCATTTGIGAVTNTGAVRAGDSALVIGCGGVGQSVLMGLGLVGAHPVVAVDVSPDRLASATGLGATAAIDGSDPEALADRLARIAPDGFEYVFEAAGRVNTTETALRHLGPGGTLVLAGMPAVDANTSVSTFQLADQGQRILGSNFGSAVPALDFPMIAEQYLAGRLPIDLLVGRSVGLDDVEQAFADMRTATGARTIVRFDA